MDILKQCVLCPRECNIDRYNQKGYCGQSDRIRIARADLHMWEEPCISGTNGSGAVFFSGCTLKCCFCQNYEISSQNKGFDISVEELADTFIRLQDMGAHNINLVNPTHFVPQIIKAIDIAADKINIPFVYNSSGYEKTETLKMLENRVNIFLPDLKYFDPNCSLKYSSATDYFKNAIKAIKEMTKISGKPIIENGVMKSGVIIRHMIMPNHRHDSIRIIEELTKAFDTDDVLISLMCQYTPIYHADKFSEINRRLSTFEYKSVMKKLEESGFDGYIQEKSSASEEFIPVFFSKKYY